MLLKRPSKRASQNRAENGKKPIWAALCDKKRIWAALILAFGVLAIACFGVTYPLAEGQTGGNEIGGVLENGVETGASGGGAEIGDVADAASDGRALEGRTSVGRAAYKPKIDIFRLETGYDRYRAAHIDAATPGVSIELDALNPAQINGARVNAGDGLLRWEDGTGTLVWEFDVPREGNYEIEINYVSLSGSGSSIERDLLIDGAAPFNEARGLVFTLNWERRETEIRRDNQGNDIRPLLTEKAVALTERLAAPDGMFNEPFRIFLTQGRHTLGFVGVREPMGIAGFRLAPVRTPPGYRSSEYAAMMDKKEAGAETGGNGPGTTASSNGRQGAAPTGYREGGDDGAASSIYIRGIDASACSSQTLYPMSDYVNSFTEPFEIGVKRLNYIGDYNWRTVGQWIEWKFTAPRAGYYKMMCRYRQNFLIGVPVARELSIDGQVPFAEAAAVNFPYTASWDIMTPGDAEGPYLFWLEAGEHTLRLRNTFGPMADVMREVRLAAVDLTLLYGKVIMVTGSTPDPYRDYMLEARIDGLADTLLDCSARAKAQADAIQRMAGARAAEAQILDRVSEQLVSLAKNPETLPARLDNFKENLDELSVWIMSMSEQPIDINYMIFAPEGAPAPAANPSFIRSLWDGLAAFFISFTKDYSYVGDAYDKNKALNVWVLMGQEQAGALKQMIDDEFTPDTGVPVNLNILSDVNTLLFATANNIPPDVCLGVGSQLGRDEASPIDYGMRGALTDLSTFADFDEVSQWFPASSLVPFRYEGKVFALPMSQIFPVLFYRKDVLAEVGLEVPETWDDLYKAVAVLQEHNMSVGIEIGDSSGGGAGMEVGAAYSMLLLQNGGAYYTDDGAVCTLDSPVGIEAFERYTELYTHYCLPQYFNFYSRFRTGEMPLGLYNYMFINNLYIAAPEIKGLWGIAPVPGTPSPGGGINRATGSGVNASVIFKASKKQGEAWAFLKWFMCESTQSRYGRHMQAVFGDDARYNTANIKAMDSLGWPVDVYAVITSQREATVGIPVVPGSYYINRHFGNAFREVDTLHELPREALIKYVDVINREIRKKREELGLQVSGADGAVNG